MDERDTGLEDGMPTNARNLRSTWHPTPVFLPGKSIKMLSKEPGGPRGRKESDTTSLLLSFTFIKITG